MSESPPIPASKMVVLGVGWLGAQFFWAFHGGALPLFLRSFTDSKFTISLVISLAGVSGCLVPPLVGYLSDRSTSRFGRRRPFIFVGILGVFLCLLGLPHVTAFGLVALIAGLMYFSLRFAETPYLSLLPDITPPQQRSTASGVMNGMGTVGLIGCFLFTFAVWDKSPVAVITTVGVVAFFAVMFTLSRIREPQNSAQKSAEPFDPMTYLKSIVSETNVLKFFLAQFFWWFGFWMISSFLTLFVVEELETPEGQSQLVLLTFSLVAAVVMVPLGMLGDRLGRKAIMSVMLAFWIVMGVFMGLSQNFMQAVVTVGLTGIPFAAIVGVGYAYFLDLIPKERTAEFVGFSIISIAVSQILAPMMGGTLIDAFGYRFLFPAAAAMMLIGLILLQFTRQRPSQ